MGGQGFGPSQLRDPKGLLNGTDTLKDIEWDRGNGRAMKEVDVNKISGPQDEEKERLFSLSMSVPFLHSQYVRARTQDDDLNRGNCDDDDNNGINYYSFNDNSSSSSNNNNSNNKNKDDDNNNNSNNHSNKNCNDENSNRNNDSHNNSSDNKIKNHQIKKVNATNRVNEKNQNTQTIENIVLNDLKISINELSRSRDGWNINNNDENDNNDDKNNNSNNSDNMYKLNYYKSQPVLGPFQPLFFSNSDLDKNDFRNFTREIPRYLITKNVSVPSSINCTAHPISKHPSGQNHPTQNHPTQSQRTQNHPTQNCPAQSQRTQNFDQFYFILFCNVLFYI